MFKFIENINNTEEIKKATLLCYSISKREIIQKDYSRIFKFFDKLTKAGIYAKEKIHISFGGYDNDKREIYEIPEIREYVKNVCDKYGYLFYFINQIDNNRSLIFACLCDFKSIHINGSNKVNLEIIYNNEINKHIENSMIEFGKKIDDLENSKRIFFTFI